MGILTLKMLFACVFTGFVAARKLKIVSLMVCMKGLVS